MHHYSQHGVGADAFSASLNSLDELVADYSRLHKGSSEAAAADVAGSFSKLRVC